MLEDVHPHWRFERNAPANDFNLLIVEEPDIIRPRGRPSGAENRRTQAFNASTGRQPSQFERVIMETAEDEEVPADVERVIRRADPAPTRARGRRARADRADRGGGDARGTRGTRGTQDAQETRGTRGARGIRRSDRNARENQGGEGDVRDGDGENEG